MAAISRTACLCIVPKWAAMPLARPCRLLSRQFAPGGPLQAASGSASLRQGILAARPLTRASAAAPASGAGTGDYVQIHYTGTLDDGSVFDSSRERDEPLAFVIGEGRVVPGFERMVVGLQVGDCKKERMEADLAYGEWREEMTASVPLANAPEGLQVGSQVELQNGMTATVTAMDEGTVSIDANHPLAGKALTFDVELTKLVPQAAMANITFGMGCFWGPALMLKRIPGVMDTTVGYSQGQVDNPSYEQVCSGTTGHNEVVTVTYDQTEATLEALLDVFFDKHDPTQQNRQGNDVGEQYRSGIYYHTADQKAACEAAFEKAQLRMSGQVVTEVEPVKNWHRAEEYHQAYLEKGGRFGRPQSAAKGCTDPIRCYG